MKMRKILALLVAVTMTLAVMPGAYAAIKKGQGIFAADDSIYVADSDDLISDGSFETADWEGAVTTGKYNGVSGGLVGRENVAKMNGDPTLVEKGITAFERVAGGHTGEYAITPAVDDLTPDAAIHRYTNDANGPTSIKFYYQSTGKQKYYVSFWAKAKDADTTASFSYYLGGIDAASKVNNPISASVTGEWTQFDAVADVANGENLMVNIFNMKAGEILIDDIEACVLSSGGDAKYFAQALAEWPNVFPYEDGQEIEGNIKLPASCLRASIVWDSSDPEVIDPETGRAGSFKDDKAVTLNATFMLGSISYTYTYNLTVLGYATKMERYLDSGDVIERYADPESAKFNLPSTVPGFAGSSVEWKSSNPDIIDVDGSYNVPDETGSVVLTANVEYMGETFTKDITVYVGKAVKHSLVPNGAFEVVENNKVVDWTVGDLSTMDVSSGGTFTYETDPETGNHFITAKDHQTWTDPHSIRMYVDLEPGKLYTLRFKMMFNHPNKCRECYNAAVLVADKNADINNGSFANVYQYGGFAFPGADYNNMYSAADGWQDVNVGLLQPTEEFHTLLICCEWLQSGQQPTTGGWSFDDFILEEVNSTFKSDVTVKYLDAQYYGEEEVTLKRDRTVKQQYGNVEYYATEEDKDDIRSNGLSYRYNPELSVDHVLVSENKDDNVIRLYFDELVKSQATVRFFSRDGKEIKRESTVTSDVYVGFPFTAGDEFKTSIEYEGTIYEYDPTSDDTIVVDEDFDKNIVDLYFVESDNLVRNGDFTDGMNYWTNRSGGAVTGASITWDSDLGTNAMTISTEGRGASNSIGTVWNVVVGKMYHLSFYVGGGKPDNNNLQYNRVADAMAHTESQTSWDIPNDATIIIPFGEQMVADQWNYMEATFTAKTNIVYFQSSWVNNIKFAKFELREIDTSKVGSVQINYVTSDGTVIKDPKIIADQVAGTTYTLPEEEKADFSQNGFSYKFVSASADSVEIVEGETAQINLTFDKVAVADVVLHFVDASGNTLKDDATVQGEIGKVFEIPAEHKVAISKGGKMYAFSSADPASLTVSGTEPNSITLTFVEVSNLILNGDFETELDGENIPEWGTGTGTSGDAGVAQMTTAHFDYKTDEYGNHYIQSKNCQALHTAGSLKRFIDLSPGKEYKLSFKIKRATELQNNGAGYKESWIGAVLVKDDHAEMADNNMNHDQIVAHRELTGSLIPENEVVPYLDMITPTVDEGWVTTELTLKPTEEYKTLLISGKWLDSGWCFDDFVLTELGDVQYGNVVLHYQDAEGKQLQGDTTIEDVASGAYTVPGTYITDIIKDGVKYRFSGGSASLKTTVVAGGTVEVTLVFGVAPSTVSINGDKATVTANGAVSGLMVITQFADDGALVDVKTTPVTVVAGGTQDVDIVYNYDAGAVEVKAFVIDSLTGIKPLANTATAVVPGAPLHATIWQSLDSLHDVSAATGKVRYTFDFVDNGCNDAAIILGNGDILKQGNGSYNFFGNGSIDLLFASGKLYYRDDVGKIDICDYTPGEKVHVVVEADVAAKTYTVTVTTAAGETTAANGGNINFRTKVDTIDTLAIVENANNGSYGDKAPFDLYDLNVEILD